MVQKFWDGAGRKAQVVEPCLAGHQWWLTPVTLNIWEADQGLRPAWANSCQHPISKITRAKWTIGVTQAIECLLWKSEALSSNPSSTKKKKVRGGGTKEFVLTGCSVSVCKDEKVLASVMAVRLYFTPQERMLKMVFLFFF
jgi:hypothetical protein